MSTADFPDAGIRWHRWSEETVKAILEKNRPVLLFVADSDGTVYPFLREILRAMPRNARLRELLHRDFMALCVEKAEIPGNEVGLADAGRRYHIAILSPSGLTPLVTFSLTRKTPTDTVREIVEVLEKLLASWIA